MPACTSNKPSDLAIAFAIGPAVPYFCTIFSLCLLELVMEQELELAIWLEFMSSGAGDGAGAGLT